MGFGLLQDFKNELNLKGLLGFKKEVTIKSFTVTDVYHVRK